MQYIANILQRIYARSSANNIQLPFGGLYRQDLKAPLIQLFKPFKIRLQRLKSIYPQLAIKALPLFDFLDLDLVTIYLILLNQPIQPGVKYESCPLFSFLTVYINGVLQYGIKDYIYN